VSTAALFPPTRDAALARIAALRPADYARSRNAIDGAVSMLSPYITHGLLSLPEVLDGVAARHRIGMQHKFVFELGWREHFRHVWQHRGDGIFASLHAGMPACCPMRPMRAKCRPTSARRAPACR
jgi:deoxyribodipyrimidine photo-lyase